MRLMWIPTLALLLMPLTGCTRYQYRLTQPAEVATDITSKSDARAEIPPLDYVMRSIEGRLVIRIYNPTEESIQLLGSESAVVDPEGQSHPLPTLAIAPQSYGRLILPPMRPRFRDTRPNIGFGVGVGVGSIHGHHPHGLRGGAMYDEPRYFDVYSASDPIYWDWDGPGTVRLLLVYDRSGERFRHELVVERFKAK